jgi:hypothetical protein
LTLHEFRQSVALGAPAQNLTPALTALWWAQKGEWDKAHELIMNEANGEGAWVHAYLHRLEGDLGNARYWYRQAGRQMPAGPLDREWDTIAEELLRVQS